VVTLNFTFSFSGSLGILCVGSCLLKGGFSYLKKKIGGAWGALSVKCLPSAQVLILGSAESLLLPLPLPLLVLSLSLFQTDIFKKRIVMIINDRYNNYRDSQKQISRLRLQKIPALNPRQKMKRGKKMKEKTLEFAKPKERK